MWIPLLIFLALIGANVIISVYLERKLSAFIQDRLGPMEVGKWGLLQLIADLIKLFQKEDITPTNANKWLFRAAPFIIFSAIFSGFALVPLNSSMQGSALSTGVMVILGIISLDVLGIILAGWGSNNKYALLGAMRSIAQILAYEIPMGISILCVAIMAGSLNLQEISFKQGIFNAEPIYLLGIKATCIDLSTVGGFTTWYIFQNPLLIIVFVLFFISALAEANRAPFDLPEAESELIAGYHTEYSGFRWAILFLAEYGMMLLMSFLGAILFLGSWNTPLPNIGKFALAYWTSGDHGTIVSMLWGSFWLLSKTYLLMLVQMWVRWTLPRFRIDQLMYLCWKILTPFGLVLLVLCSFYRILHFI